MNISVRASSAFENIFQTPVSWILYASWCWKHKEDSLCHLVHLRGWVRWAFCIVSPSYLFLSFCLPVFLSFFLFFFCLFVLSVILSTWGLGKASTLHCFIIRSHTNKSSNKYSIIAVEIYRELMNNNRNCLVGQLTRIRYCRLSNVLFDHQQDLTICEQKKSLTIVNKKKVSQYLTPPLPNLSGVGGVK